MALSEDELEAMEGKARKLTILDLKKRALAAKQAGDIESAMGCLKKAKKLEVEDARSESGEDEDDEEPPYSNTLPLFWQKVALLCKQGGDIDRAKQALMHSKELEAAEAEAEIESEMTNPVEEEPTAESETKPLEATISTAAPVPNLPSDAKGDAPIGNEDLPPPLYENVHNFSAPPPPPAYDNLVEKPKVQGATEDNLLQNCQVEGANEEEAAMLAELMGGGGTESRETRKPQAARARTPTPPPAKVESAGDADEVSMSGSDDESMAGDSPIATETPAMTFTDEELMDEEMMLEFASGGAQGIPSQEEYAAKVLAYKKLALKFKQEGNIPKATQNLRAAKQLEKVGLALQAVVDRGTEEEDPRSWLESLDPEESELLGELLEGGGSADASLLEGGPTDKLTIEDLEEMEDDNDILELVEMMGPDALPTVEEVTAKITQEKQNALRYKQEGNIEMAKSSLLKSKKTKLLAVRLAEIYRKLDAKKDSLADDGDGSENDAPVSMEALEALVGGDAKPREAATTKPSPPPEPPKDPWLLKPSGEIKAEVIRLKNDKQVQEATRLLKLFKQKLAQEQVEAEREKVAKMVSTIQKRLEICSAQRRLWQYYQWFGKETTVGADQCREWMGFEKDCQKAIRLLTTEGSTSVKLAPRGSANGNSKGNVPTGKKLYLLEDDVTSLVEYCTTETTAAAAAASMGDETSAAEHPMSFLEENALEVVVLGLFQMEENEKLQKLLARKTKSEKAISAEPPDVRINAKLQLPIQPEDPSRPFLFDLEPSDLFPLQQPLANTQFRYGFDSSSTSCRKQVILPRKDPKHERALLRRIESKTLQLSVFYLHNQNKRKEAAAAAAAAAGSKKKSWFFGRGGEAKLPENDADSGEGESKDIFLGKVIIEFKPLLSRGCLAGDFPILVNSRAIGGVLRVCLRTRPVLDPDRYEGLPWVPSDGAPASLSISTYKQGLSFAFPNEANGKNDQSIESIKQESASFSASTQGAN